MQGYFYCWRDTGLFQTINHILVAATRELEGREASPTAGIIDSQSVITTESGGISGYNAGKKFKGRKRHIITDTFGLMLFALVHTADIQDRDGAPDLFKAIQHHFPWLRHVFADGGYAGEKLRSALAGCGEWTVEIIRRSDAAKGFHVLPRRWVVTHFRMVWTMPKTGKGPREIRRKRNRMGQYRQHQGYDTQAHKLLCHLMNFSIRLLNNLNHISAAPE